jgi:hypothetical protein
MIRTTAAIAVVTGLLAAVAAGQTAPATNAAGPAIPNAYEPGSPKGAAEQLSYFLAVGNADGIRSILTAKTDTERQMVDAMVRMSQAIAHLREVGVKRYGDQATYAALGNPQVSAVEEHNRLESALLTVELDKAVLTFPDPAADSIILRRSNDKWTIPVSEKAAKLSEEELGTRAEDLDAAAKVVEQVADLCEGGKWATANDVSIAIQERMLQSQQSRLPAATQSTSQPATKPE